MIDKKLFQDLAKDVNHHLEMLEIKSALSKMESMLYLCPSPQIEEELNSLSNAFEGMLNCVRKGFADKDREASFVQMQEKAYNIFWQIQRRFKLTVLEGFYRKAYWLVPAALPYHIYQEKLERFQQDPTLMREHEATYSLLFHQLFTASSLTAQEVEELENLMNSDSIALTDRLLTVSALTLSTLEFPDPQKVSLLTRMCRSNVTEVQARSMVGMLIVTNHFFIKNIKFGALADFLELMKEEENKEKFCNLLLFFLKSKGAQELCESMSEEMKSQIVILSREQTKDLDEEEREDMFREKMDESAAKLAQQSKQGADVLWGMFSRLKAFTFFHEAAHWFYPFTTQHSAVKGKNIQLLPQMENLFNMAPFCDSDKWSFFLLLNLPNAKIVFPNGMIDMPPAKAKTGWNEVCINYMHDLYRFFRLFPYHNEFASPYRAFSVHPFLGVLKTLSEEQLMELSKAYMEEEEYVFANLILNFLPEKLKFVQERKAYCMKQMEEYDDAIRWYQKCLGNGHNLNIMKQLVYCYKKKHNYPKVIQLLEEMIKADAANELKYQTQLAQVLMQTKKYKKALALWYKVEFMKPNDPKAMQAIIWCNLMCKQPQKALTFWEKIKKKSAEDWLNGGDIYWALKDEATAYKCYQHYFEVYKDKEEGFMNFSDDFTSLSNCYEHLSNIDLALMKQALGIN